VRLAVAACTAIGLGIWSTSLSHSLQNERSARAAAVSAMEILVDPNARTVQLKGGNGVLAVDSTGRGALIVRRLPAAPAGKTYEAWVASPAVQPAGVFTGNLVKLSRRVPRGALVMVTLERTGGVNAPTQQPLLRARA